MNNLDYECHITISTRKIKSIKTIAKIHGWKLSKIKGDPVLGNRKTFYYATKHEDQYSKLRRDMLLFTIHLSMLGLNRGKNIVRRKIERTIFDERFIPE